VTGDHNGHTICQCWFMTTGSVDCQLTTDAEPHWSHPLNRRATAELHQPYTGNSSCKESLMLLDSVMQDTPSADGSADKDFVQQALSAVLLTQTGCVRSGTARHGGIRLCQCWGRCSCCSCTAVGPACEHSHCCGHRDTHPLQERTHAAKHQSTS
jgi:hypothetical protein